MIAIILVAVPAAVRAGAGDTPLAAEAIFQSSSKAVVRVIAKDDDNRALAQGSGFFIDPNGIVVTNHHVIRGASHVDVVLPDGATRPALGYVAVDVASDLILLKTDLRVARSLQLGKAPPNVGAAVYAIGSPLNLSNTLTQGIVSGIRPGPRGEQLIQTTAAISPGSSGGPLLSTSGEVIGVTTASLLEGQNLNFAANSSALERLFRDARDKPVKFDRLPSHWIWKFQAVAMQIRAQHVEQALALGMQNDERYLRVIDGCLRSALELNLRNEDLLQVRLLMEAVHKSSLPAEDKERCFAESANMYARLGMWPEAVAVLDSLHGNHSSLWYGIARAQAESGLYDDARRSAAKAGAEMLSAIEDHIALIELLGLALAGDTQGFVARIDQGLPKELSRALLARELLRIRKVELLLMMLRKEPFDKQLLICRNLARRIVAERDKEFAVAISAAASAADSRGGKPEKSPAECSTWTRLARLERFLGNESKANYYLKRAISAAERIPVPQANRDVPFYDFVYPWSEVAALAFDLGAADQAREAVRKIQLAAKAYTSGSDAPKYLQTLARVQRYLHDTTGYASTLEVMANFDPSGRKRRRGDALLQSELIEIHCEDGNWSAAQELISQSRERLPDGSVTRGNGVRYCARGMAKRGAWEELGFWLSRLQVPEEQCEAFEGVAEGLLPDPPLLPGLRSQQHPSDAYPWER